MLVAGRPVIPAGYDDLIAAGRGDPFDRQVFAHALILGLAEGAPLNAALGWERSLAARLLARYFPRHRRAVLEAARFADGADEAPEEPDLRRLLLDHRSGGALEGELLARLIARRSLKPNHLWQDLGLVARSDLSRLLLRHFRLLAERNVHDMKWKKFFYRELCRLDGLLLCKAPVCDACEDFSLCFGGESGEPLLALARSRRRP